MIDLKALLTEEKTLEAKNGKNHYFKFPVATLKAINQEILDLKKPDKQEAKRQEAIVMEAENPTSIVLSFIAGRINLLLNPHEAQIRLNNLMLSFHEMRNTEAAAFIASIILEKIASYTALRVMAEIADYNKDEESKWKYYESYVKANVADTEIIIKVADNYEAKGDKEKAKAYYQRAIQRLPYNQDVNERKVFFEKLLANGESQFTFYFSYLNKVSVFCNDLYSMLLKDLLKRKNAFTEATPAIERNKNANAIIDTAKAILQKNDRDPEAKEVLVIIFKERYGQYSRYNECSKTYNILSSSNPAKTAEDFIKEVSFSKGTFVLQESTGRVGIIMDIDKLNNVTVKYSNRPDGEQKVSLNMLLKSFKALPKTDIRAIKKGKKPEAIKAQIQSPNGADWLLKTMLLSSPNNTSTLKEMKDQICPSILDEKEWKDVEAKMKAIAIKDHYIDINKNSFHYRDYPLSLEERRKEAFDSVKEFEKKVVVLTDSIVMDNFDATSEPFLEMCSYFINYAKDDRNSDSTRLESILLMEILAEKGYNVVSEVEFLTICPKKLLSTEKKALYDSLSFHECRKKFVELLIATDNKSYETLELIFPKNPTKDLMKKMTEANEKKFNEYVAKVLQNYDDNLIAFCFFVQNGVNKDMLKNARMTQKQLVERELNALSSICRNTGDMKQANDIRKDLIDRDQLGKYIKDATEDELKTVATHLKYNAGLKEGERNGYRKLILAKYPEFDFGDKVKEEKPVEISVVRGFLCTKKSFEAKRAEMDDIKNVQLPQTLKEINDARELGDLRENSEYQYAKDHKRHLDRMYEEIATDLSKVKIMSPDMVLDGMIGFGTKVRLTNLKDKKEVTYTFFGRWESDPDNNVIDMNAPIGLALINHKVGDVVDFSIGSNKIQYKVEEITKVAF